MGYSIGGAPKVHPECLMAKRENRLILKLFGRFCLNGVVAFARFGASGMPVALITGRCPVLVIPPRLGLLSIIGIEASVNCNDLKSLNEVPTK